MLILFQNIIKDGFNEEIYMRFEIKRLILSAFIPAIFILTFYLIKFYEIAMDTSFVHLGVYPLEKKGVIGIFCHPLVHGSIEHLAANSLPFFLLSWCLYYFYKDTASLILFFIWTVCGTLTFLIGTPGWHIGASGIIYGMAFFLFFSGIMKGTRALIAISLLITFLYGGIVWSMFPQFTKPGISWEGHLSGAAAGMIAAILFRNKGPKRAEPKEYNDEENEELYRRWTESLAPPQQQAGTTEGTQAHPQTGGNETEDNTTTRQQAALQPDCKQNTDNFAEEKETTKL